MKRILSLIMFLFFVSCASSHICLKNKPLERLQAPMGKVLVVVAHQDDELFILSRLKQHLELKDTIFIVWTTASFQKGKKYADRRIKESLEGIKRLGIPRENCKFLLFQDGKTHLKMNKIIVKLKQFISKHSPDCIYVHAYEGGHIDHDVAHYSTVKALEELDLKSTVYEFPVYSAYKLSKIFPFKMRNFPPNLGTQCRKLSEQEYDFVLKYRQIFKSQRFPFGFYVSLFPGKKRTYGIEYLRTLPQYDYLKIPPGYQIAYKRFLWGTNFDDFKNAVLKNQKNTHSKLFNGKTHR